MKSILVMALFASVPAMALASGYDSEESVVNYISWCDGNSVIAQDSQGNLFVRANCDDQGLQCKTIESYRSFGSTVTASCVQK